jgi:hypothetical protein
MRKRAADPRCLITSLAVAFLACTDSSSHAVDERVDFFACDVSSDCIVVPESCCGSCGAPTRGDAVAINAALAGEHSRAACGENTGCPACAPLFIDPTLAATCRDQRCELVDLREHPVTACTRDDDCKVRTPDCCECGGDTEPGRLLGIASSAEREYGELVCGPEQACPECAPIYPPEVTVACNASGHCETDDARLP